MNSSAFKSSEVSKISNFGYGKNSSNGETLTKSRTISNINSNINHHTTLSSISAASLESFSKKTPNSKSPSEDKKFRFNNEGSPSLLISQLEQLSNRYQSDNTPINTSKYPLANSQHFTSPNTTILAIKEKEYLKIRQDHSSALHTLASEIQRLVDASPTATRSSANSNEDNNNSRLNIDSILSRYQGSPSDNKVNSNNNNNNNDDKSSVQKIIGDAIADAMRSQQLSQQLRPTTPIIDKPIPTYNNDAYNTLSALQTHLNTLEVKHNTYESNTTRKLFDLQLRIDKLEQVQNSNISDIQKKISERVDRDTSNNMFHRSGDISSGRLLNELNNRLELLERKILKDKRLASLDFEQFENSIHRSHSFDSNHSYNNNNNNYNNSNNNYDDGHYNNNYNINDLSNALRLSSTYRSSSTTNNNESMTSAEKLIERRHYPWLTGEESA